MYPCAVRAVLLLTLTVAGAARPPAPPTPPPSGFDARTGGATVVRRPLDAMVAIRGGLFTMGASAELQSAALDLCREEIGPRHRPSCNRDVVETEGPQRKVYVSGFSLDRVEVTVAAYRACVRAAGCAPGPLTVADSRFLGAGMPVTSVTFGEAEAYCSWRGARLPTEAEWERAARGTDGRVWPWGNALRLSAFNHGRFAAPDDAGGDFVALIRPDGSDGATFVSLVGAHPEGVSPEGILDLAGNAMEWTADYYRAEPPQTTSTVNPRGPDAGAMRVLRGGSWRQPAFFARTTYREAAAPDTRSSEIGFRCARGGILGPGDSRAIEAR
ncbi:MAG: Sulfatase modifying factor 1 precursor [Myxococcales bacterium]|nr:Sulfatase modifying factor 1 precursor [Myxococcales bacterium]